MTVTQHFRNRDVPLISQGFVLRSSNLAHNVISSNLTDPRGIKDRATWRLSFLPRMVVHMANHGVCYQS